MGQCRVRLQEGLGIRGLSLKTYTVSLRQRESSDQGLEMYSRNLETGVT